MNDKQTKSFNMGLPSIKSVMPGQSLGELIRALQDYGKPRVGLLSGGWHASVDMYVTSKGASFDIKSDFTHDTPEEAATVCLHRVHETLADLKN
jgi:hypothetical protein